MRAPDWTKRRHRLRRLDARHLYTQSTCARSRRLKEGGALNNPASSSDSTPSTSSPGVAGAAKRGRPRKDVVVNTGAEAASPPEVFLDGGAKERGRAVGGGDVHARGAREAEAEAGHADDGVGGEGKEDTGAGSAEPVKRKNKKAKTSRAAERRQMVDSAVQDMKETKEKKKKGGNESAALEYEQSKDGIYNLGGAETEQGPVDHDAEMWTTVGMGIETTEWI
ncbi:hypothetical protein LTS18_000363 [Coniosporium uncinatum]|uniref:Uncharacterized protein n=1 Tax=Coniosporium uncinatum TaxID=93489 RepID=A0ACC3CUZ3_9PEZI|nr:hypothetical protein LTS18_000363 [Coniosporium uncinatum]